MSMRKFGLSLVLAACALAAPARAEVDTVRIALPTVKISGQAVVLQMAAEKAFGEGQHARLDELTVSRANPDGFAAVTADNNEINSQFSSPPYQQMALRTGKVHVVMTTRDVF